eukprot:5102285-Pyramimonas_sp.AAC.1
MAARRSHCPSHIELATSTMNGRVSAVARAPLLVAEPGRSFRRMAPPRIALAACLRLLARDGQMNRVEAQ